MLHCSYQFEHDPQIELDNTTLDAAKSSIVYGVTKNVSTAARAVRRNFILSRRLKDEQDHLGHRFVHQPST